MPSPNPRVQVCATPILYRQLRTLAKARNCTLSNVVQELCAQALLTDEVREEYSEACEMFGEVPIRPDMRKRPGQRPHFISHEPEHATNWWEMA